jgi:hypothetical protein
VAYQILIGPSGYDAVNAVRQLTEDTSAVPVIADAAYQAYAELVNEDFSRFVPVDILVGNPVTLTSPLLTVSMQQRYVCTPANGFTFPPMQVTDVLYRATNAFSAASEIAYLALLPFSPLNRFLFTPSLLDSPSERILRDEYLSELDHYGKGYYRIVRDQTGLQAIELYPIPQQGGTAVYARYTAQHQITTVSGNSVIATIPEDLKRWWVQLLYAEILIQESERFGKLNKAKAGLIDLSSDPRMLVLKGKDIREAAYLALGEANGVALMSY